MPSQRSSLSQVARDIWSVLPDDQRTKGVFLCLLLVAAALFEVVGIASIFPFLAALTAEGGVEEQSFLSDVYAFGSFDSRDDFVATLGVASLCAILMSSAVRAASIVVQNKFIQAQRHIIATRLLRSYLHRRYEFFVQRNTTELAKNILTEVDVYVDRGLSPLTQIISATCVLGAVAALLVMVDPLVAVVVISVLGMTYSVIYGSVRGIVGRSGRDRLVAGQQRFQSAHDALAGVKALKMQGLEDHALSAFAKPSVDMANAVAAGNILSQFPRYLVEALAFSVLVGSALAIFLSEGDVGVSMIIPVISLYAFAGYRALPAVQNVYQAMTNLLFARENVLAILSELRGEVHEEEPLENASGKNGGDLRFTSSLTLEGVGYDYPGDSQVGLRDVNFRIGHGSSVAIVGQTGAGKSTLMDLILGLLEPHFGQVAVDGVTLTRRRTRRWRQQIGYVPQEVFLSMSSIAQNIALGVPATLIDRARVIECARIAQLHKFVQELPSGYDTLIGDARRLSGGQRQRIGIARALYNNPAILVFDEATSALDSATEAQIMNEIGALAENTTIIMVTHRMASVALFDTIVVLAAGQVVAQGTYEELMSSSDEFRTLVSGLKEGGH